jgi:hypothetical protein
MARLAKGSIIKAIKAAVSTAGLLAMVAVVAYAQTGSLAADSKSSAETAADTTGNLHVPDVYRTTYGFLGT